jgi:hypothetical protein
MPSLADALFARCPIAYSLWLTPQIAANSNQLVVLSRKSNSVTSTVLNSVQATKANK